MIKTYRLPCGSNTLELGNRTLVMGVVNVTPDSFSDGGDFFSSKRAVDRGIELYQAGADILDIGGESTRPFSEAVSIEEEIRRVVPVIESLSRNVSIPISIDTRKAEVAAQALNAGASMINDISALYYDPEMAKLAARRKVPVVLMHIKGNPENMQIEPVYRDVVKEVILFLENAVSHALENGIDRSHLVIDPGIGFGKTFSHNLTLLKHLDRFLDLDVPLLIGTSRKAFIRNLLKKDNGEKLDPQSPEVEIGTQATVAAAALKGAHFVRVHHVANAVATLKIIDAIKNSPDR
jgi:dihydropteroate synthase